MRIAVVGASGFVGHALCASLVDSGQDVVALSRHPPDILGAAGRAVDVADEEALYDCLVGCEIAYYLVHSLGVGDFRSRDQQLAESFGRVGAAAGIRRIVYLGGLGNNPESEHLVSRQEVGVALGCGNVPVVEMRAAVVLGAGSISFEMLRYLTERLPFMICPRWVRTAIQPIALVDLIRYLVRALDVEPGVYEIGGADITTYREMISAYAKARDLRRRRIIDVPYLTPRLSSYWLDLVTPVDRRISHALIESLVTEVVVVDRERTDDAFGINPLNLTEALSATLNDQALAIDRDLLSRQDGLRDGVYTVRVAVPISAEASARLDVDLDHIGGSYSWYGLAVAWRVRAMVGRLFGERWRLSSTHGPVQGETVDWWFVARRDPGILILRAIGGFPEKAGLATNAAGTSWYRLGRFAQRESPDFFTGSCFNQCIAASFTCWLDTVLKRIGTVQSVAVRARECGSDDGR